MAYSYYGRSYEDAMSDLAERKNKNFSDNLELYRYSPLIIGGKQKCLVLYDENGDIQKTLCVKCLATIDRSPYYNSQYVCPLCRHCLKDISHIEDTNKKEQKMNQRSKKSDPTNVSIDWSGFESSMAAGNAKLCELAKQYNIYPNDMKELLVTKYQQHIIFKKGRHGGIYWATKA